MATWYVSKSADNGYVVGNDANDGLSKTTPFLTLAAAFSAAGASGGTEDIIINDGAYVGTDLDATNQYILVGSPATSTVVRPENAGQVSLVPGVTTACIRLNSNVVSGTTLELRDLTLGRLTTGSGVDATHLVNLPGVPDGAHNLIFTRVKFYNAGTYGINQPRKASVTIKDCEWHLTRSTGGRGLIYTNTATEGAYIIDGLALNHLKATVNGHGPIQLDMAANGVSVSISNVWGDVTADADASGTAVLYGIRIVNAANASIRNVNLALADPSAHDFSVYGVTMYGSDAALSSSAQLMSNVTVSMDTDGGFGVSLGGDLGDALDNKADNSRLKNIKVTGNARFIAGNGHGIGFGTNDNCKLEGGEVSYVDIGVLDKFGDLNTVSGVLAHKCGGGPSNVAFFSKGSTNGKFYNNTVVIEDGYEANAYEAVADGVNSTDNEFNYNVVAVLSDTASKVINVAVSQTATFDYNHYYIVGSLPANPFTYQATNYASAATWIAARETNGVDVSADPFIDSSGGDYRPSYDANGYTGVDWWSEVPHGTDGRRYAMPPIVGAYGLRPGGYVKGIGSLPLRVLPLGVDLIGARLL